MKRRTFISAFGATSLTAILPCCGNSQSTSPALKRGYTQANLAASSPAYNAQFTFPGMVDAWGIATRPAGAGGHFWVTGGGVSWQFVGDVRASPDVNLQKLFQDGLKEVALPGADSLIDSASIGKATGTAFNGAPLASDLFVVKNQSVTANGTVRALEGSARFVFVTDSGVVSAWTDVEKGTDLTVRADGPAVEVFNGGAQGMAFFGVAIKGDTWDTLWLADFGTAPQIRTLNKNWQLVPTIGFANPFATGNTIDTANPTAGKAAKPGDYVPFNIQEVGQRVFVMYAKSKAKESDPTAFDAAEEDALDAAQEKASDNQPNAGKVVEFTRAGTLVRIIEDGWRLNAPWGVAIAPANFGELSGAILVGNFGGAGHIAAYNDVSGKFVDFMRNDKTDIIGIEGLWALQFGNGVSLGDLNALYFAAGPEEEKDGLFGSLRLA